MNSLPTYIKKNKAVIGLEREPINGKRYDDNLCLFRCLALHRGGEVRHLESAVTKLYETYKQDVPIERFAGVTLDDLYRIETTFQTNVCVYKLVESDDDDDDGKKIAELVRRSLCHYSDTMYLNLHETHFSYIQNIQMYCHSYKCRKCGESLFKKPYDLIRHERTCTGGVRRIYPGACTIRLRRYSNVWTTRKSESPNRCGTTRTEPPLISNVTLTPSNFHRTVTKSRGWHATFR